MFRAGQLIPGSIFTRAPQALSSHNPYNEAIERTQRQVADPIGHNRSAQPKFERVASTQPKQNKKLASWTRAQLGQELVSMYSSDRFDPVDLVNCCVETGLVKHAGGGTYITEHTIPEICKGLEEKYQPLAEVRAQIKKQLERYAQAQQDKQIQAKTHYEEKKSARYAAGLGSDELRNVPSYAFCLHPDMRFALASLDEEITKAQAAGIVTNEFSSYWKTRMKNVSSNRECNTVLSEVRNYLGKR